MNSYELASQCSIRLKALRDETQAVRQRAAAINDGSRAPSESELQELEQLYRSTYDRLQFRYTQTALYFSSHGSDLLHVALQHELRDFEIALQVLAGIQADRQRHEATRWAIQQQAHDSVMRLRSEAHANQMRSHEEHNRRWSAAFNYRPTPCCPYCARPLGLWGQCAFCHCR